MPQVRQSVPGPNKTGEAHHGFFEIDQLKAIEKYHFRPRYALANLGHPSSPYWFFYAIRCAANSAANLLAGSRDWLDVAGKFCKIVDSG